MSSFGDGWVANDGIKQPSPLTIPHVMVPDNSNVLPIVITCSPIFSCEEFPNGSGTSFASDIFTIRSTEMSLQLVWH
jgi:hypothetical protein